MYAHIEELRKRIAEVGHEMEGGVSDNSGRTFWQHEGEQKARLATTLGALKQDLKRMEEQLKSSLD